MISVKLLIGFGIGVYCFSYNRLVELVFFCNHDYLSDRIQRVVLP